MAEAEQANLDTANDDNEELLEEEEDGQLPPPAVPAASTEASPQNISASRNVKFPKDYDGKKDGPPLELFLGRFDSSCDEAGKPDSHRGVILLQHISYDVQARIMPLLGLQLGSKLSPESCPYEGVKQALRDLRLHADEADENICDAIMKLTVGKEGHVGLLLEAEHLRQTLHEPITDTTFQWMVNKRVHLDFKPLVQFNRGQPWADYKLYRGNYLNQARQFDNRLPIYDPKATAPKAPFQVSFPLQWLVPNVFPWLVPNVFPLWTSDKRTISANYCLLMFLVLLSEVLWVITNI